MKKILKIGGLCFLAGILVLCACVNQSKNSPSDAARVKTSKQESGFGFDIFTENREIFLFPDRKKDSPSMTLSFRLAHIAPEGAAASLEGLIRELLYGNGSPKNYAQRCIAAYKERYMEMKGVLKEYADMRMESLNWQYFEFSEPVVSNSRALIFRRTRDYYLGGAHGMMEKKYFVINREKVKTASIDDLLREDAKPALTRSLEEALRFYGGLKSGVPLSAGIFFEDAIPITENFFLSPQGLGFHWDAAEIAPYSEGPVEIILPWDAIEELLSEEGKFLIAGFNEL
jgi:hypothetical protein